MDSLKQINQFFPAKWHQIKFAMGGTKKLSKNLRQNPTRSSEGIPRFCTKNINVGIDSSTSSSLDDGVSFTDDFNELDTQDDFFSTDNPDFYSTIVNPATGLPMVGGIGGVDVEGNPYGTDFNEKF